MPTIDKECPECGKPMTIALVDWRNPETDELEGGVKWVCHAESKVHIADITDEEIDMLNGNEANDADEWVEDAGWQGDIPAAWSRLVAIWEKVVRDE